MVLIASSGLGTVNGNFLFSLIYAAIHFMFTGMPRREHSAASAEIPDHPEEAEAIARHAHEYISQFRDKKRERLISLLVMQKYFRCTGQLP